MSFAASSFYGMVRKHSSAGTWSLNTYCRYPSLSISASTAEGNFSVGSQFLFSFPHSSSETMMEHPNLQASLLANEEPRDANRYEVNPNNHQQQLHYPGMATRNDSKPSPSLSTSQIEGKSPAFGPSVHPNLINPPNSNSPYAIPKYDEHHYTNQRHPIPGMMGSSQFNFGPAQMAKIFVWINGMYVCSAVLMLIQGFGIMIQGEFHRMMMGLFAMSFGALAIMHDLRSVVLGVEVTQWFPFLGNYFGRGLTIFFFGVLSELADYGDRWNYVVMVYDMLVCMLCQILYFASSSFATTGHSRDNDSNQRHTPPLSSSQSIFTDI